MHPKAKHTHKGTSLLYRDRRSVQTVSKFLHTNTELEEACSEPPHMSQAGEEQSMQNQVISETLNTSSLDNYLTHIFPISYFIFHCTFFCPFFYSGRVTSNATSKVFLANRQGTVKRIPSSGNQSKLFLTSRNVFSKLPSQD